MALRRRERVELHLATRGAQVLGDRLLLVDRVQHVGLHAEHQRALDLELGVRLLERSAAVLGQVELVGGTR